MEEVSALRQRIKDAVAEEDYELAAELKKRLRAADQSQAIEAQIAAAVDATARAARIDAVANRGGQWRQRHTEARLSEQAPRLPGGCRRSGPGRRS